MTQRPTTLERAYELARSGEYTGVAAIRDMLKQEKFLDVDGQLYGPTLQKQLGRICREARKTEDDTPASSNPGNIRAGE